MYRDMAAFYGREDAQYERQCDRRAPPETNEGDEYWAAKGRQVIRLRDDHEDGEHEDEDYQLCPLCEDTDTDK